MRDPSRTLSAASSRQWRCAGSAPDPHGDTACKISRPRTIPPAHRAASWQRHSLYGPCAENTCSPFAEPANGQTGAISAIHAIAIPLETLCLFCEPSAELHRDHDFGQFGGRQFRPASGIRAPGCMEALRLPCAIPSPPALPTHWRPNAQSRLGSKQDAEEPLVFRRKDRIAHTSVYLRSAPRCFSRFPIMRS